MEIRIRTYEELRADRVTIEITGTGAEVTEFAETRLPSRNLYTDDEVATLQASEAELVAGPLRIRIAELERTLAASIMRETDLENRVQGYDHDRKTERDRADRERQALVRMENQVAELTRRIDNARVLLMDSQIKVAQDKAVTKAAVTMAEAIGRVLDTLA